jgi:hypothetical protein
VKKLSSVTLWTPGSTNDFSAIKAQSPLLGCLCKRKQVARAGSHVKRSGFAEEMRIIATPLTVIDPTGAQRK